MPALNIEFTAEELDTLRNAAEQRGVSIKTIAKQAILENLSEHARLSIEYSQEIARKSAQLNARLA